MGQIAVVSDIHGNYLALRAVVADIRRRGIAPVLNLGDHVSGPLWPRETAELLMRQDWVHLSGNCDRVVASEPPERMGASDKYAHERLEPAQLEWLESLPATARAEPDIFLCHGTDRSDTEPLLETIAHGYSRLAEPQEIVQRLEAETLQASLVLCGHTHVQRIAQAGQALVINPGSVGLPAYGHDYPEPHLIQAGSPHARYAILSRGGLGWTVEFVALEYDHSAAAARARENGRGDWAAALETGYARKP